jgi:hypothetical protein
MFRTTSFILVAALTHLKGKKEKRKKKKEKKLFLRKMNQRN